MNILVVRPDAMGDAVCILPMLSVLKQQFPNYTVSVLAKQYTAPIFELCQPKIDNVVIDQRAQLGFWQYVKWLKAQRFDCVILGYLDDPFYLYLSLFAGIPVRIGNGGKLLLRPFLTHPVHQDFRHPMLHEVEHNLRLLTPLKPTAIQPPCPTLSIQRNPKSIIGIHVGYGAGNRSLSPEHYAEIIDKIHQNTAYKVVLTGSGEKEAQTASAILQLCQNPPENQVGNTTLNQLIDLLKTCTAFIGAETGPTHLASAMGVPVFSISPTKFIKSYRWGPWNTLFKIWPYQDGSCPLRCQSYACQKTFCTQINVAPITTAILDFLHIIERNPAHTPEQDRYDRLKASGSIVLYALSSKLNDIARVQTIHTSLQKNGYATHILCRNKRIANQLKSDVVIHPLNLIKLWQFIGQKDVMIVYLIPPKFRFIWPILRALIAPFVYCPPIVETRFHTPQLF